MPRNFIRRYTPDAEKVRNHRHLQFLGSHLHAHDLWHLNRESVAKGFAVGFFWALIPIPMQMIFASITAIVWRANLPLSFALVWITNPLTIVPVFYLLYLLGSWMTGHHAMDLPPDVSIDWCRAVLSEIWLPLVIGSLTGAIIAGFIGYYGIHLLWRMHVVRRWKRSRLRLKKRYSGSNRPSVKR